MAYFKQAKNDGFKKGGKLYHHNLYQYYLYIR